MRKVLKGKNHPMFGKEIGKYRGTNYQKKYQSPWTKVWHSTIKYNGNQMSLGHFNDPYSSELVFYLVWSEIYGKS